jgi:hypothetical protein
MPNEIDLLMSRLDEINHKDPPLDKSDIAILIANARRQRQLKSQGQKPSRTKIDLNTILDIVRVAPDNEPKPEPTFKRRKL